MLDRYFQDGWSQAERYLCKNAGRKAIFMDWLTEPAAPIEIFKLPRGLLMETSRWPAVLLLPDHRIIPVPKCKSRMQFIRWMSKHLEVYFIGYLKFT